MVFGILVSKLKKGENSPEKVDAEFLESDKLLPSAEEEVIMMYQGEILQHSKDIERLHDISFNLATNVNAMKDDILDGVKELKKRVGKVETEVKQLQDEISDIYAIIAIFKACVEDLKESTNSLLDQALPILKKFAEEKDKE